MDLSPEDQRHLKAAEGWLVLGSHIEANKELDEIEPTCRVHPDVLQIRWLVLSKAEDWTACHDIAEALITIAPDRRFGWVHKAFSLEKLGRTDEARQTLRHAVGRLKPPHYLPSDFEKPGDREEAVPPVISHYSLSRQHRNLSRSKHQSRTEWIIILLTLLALCGAYFFWFRVLKLLMPIVSGMLGMILAACPGR